MSELESKGSKQLSSNKELSYPMLAIDHGRKRVGLAVSDFKGILSAPLAALHFSKKHGLEGLMREIASVATENRVRSILLGLPQAFEKSHHDKRSEIEQFGETLEKYLHLPVYYHDESYSSQDATALMIESNTSQSKRKKCKDSVAAAIFLQAFLDDQHKQQKQNDPEEQRGQGNH